jgi:hypothetical protein
MIEESGGNFNIMILADIKAGGTVDGAESNGIES